MSHPRLHWTAYLWPGLPQVWVRGSWVGLGLAVGFTALGNVLLAATFVWQQWLPARAVAIGYGALACIWLLAWWDARADWRRMLREWSTGESLPAGGDAQCNEWFQQAQQAYLSGDWVAAEQTLTRLLRLAPQDVEARLLRATLYGHEQRWEAALAELDELERWDAARPWQFEMARGRQRFWAAGVESLPADADAAHRGEAPAPCPVPASAGRDAPDAVTDRRMAA